MAESCQDATDWTWNYDPSRATVTSAGLVSTAGGSCFAASLTQPMPPNSGNWVYHVAIKDFVRQIVLHKISVVTEDFTEWTDEL